MTIDKKSITCPTCGKKGTWTSENSFKPFCSERCKLIDLGEWASGTYHVPGETVDPEEWPEDKQKKNDSDS
jgi:uncharacterized protein